MQSISRLVDMTKKADEPRTTMRVPVSFRELVRKNAKQMNVNMMDYLISKVPKVEI